MRALAMREAPETMAMLTARGASLVGGRGGRDRLTAQDVAAAVAMAHLSEGAELLAFALGCQGQADIRRWHSYWLGRVRRMAEDWEAPPHRVTTFALVTSVHVLDPGNCAHCHGAGIHQNQRTCVQCEGSGKRGQSDAGTAFQLGVTPTEWRDAWSGRYRLAMHRLAMWQSDADSALSRSIR
jgi:hypothetical protein